MTHEVSGVAILLYDAFLLFEVEYSAIWKKKLSKPQVAYILYKYATIANMLALLSSASKTKSFLINPDHKHFARYHFVSVPLCRLGAFLCSTTSC